MPRPLTPELEAHLAQEVTTLAACWRVTRPDGVLILGTEHDQDIIIEANSPSHPYTGTYLARAGITGSDVRSTSNMSVDNMEVEGAINAAGDLTVPGLSPSDIEAGLFDNASVVLFLVNWQAPDDGQIVLRTGNIGEISRTAEGKYKTELRGLAQKLSQNIIRTYGSSCDAELGDARCGIDLTAYTLTGTVTAVTSNRRFMAELNEGSPTITIDIELFLPMPNDIEVGDEFSIRPGCDKSAVTCRETFANIKNFRGHGYLVPGIGELISFGGQTAERVDRPPGELRYGIFEVALDRLIPRLVGIFPGTPAGMDEVYYNGGLVTWTSGANDTYRMEVKSTSEP